MKRVTILIAVMCLPLFTQAAEISVNLDRLAVLNDQDDLSAESKLAMHFALPEEISQRQIIYAEMVIDIPVAPPGADSLFELLLFPLTSDWQEENIDYEGSETITDSVLVGAKMIKLGESEVFRIDITPFVKNVVSGARANYGLIAMADLLGDYNLRIPGDLGGPMRNAARVRVVYR